MSPLSTTKKYVFDRLARELAGVQVGMTPNEVQAQLQAPHVELADDLVFYDGTGRVEDSVLLQACQSGDPSAPLLALISVLLADDRYSALLNGYITDDNGIDTSRYNTDRVEAEVPNYFTGLTSTRKVATNILGYLEQVGIVEADKHGGTIVGVAGELPTTQHVPQVIAAVIEWLERKLRFPIPTDARLDLVTGLGIHRWINLSRDEFRRAAVGSPQPVARSQRAPLPPHLTLLHSELSRKRQVVLQGPPGTGKTYLASQYIDWVSAGLADAARLTTLSAALPRHERGADRIVDELLSTGAAAVWDIVQFHPSYTYEDFVRGLHAKPVAGGVTFEAREGVLGHLASVAEELDRRGITDLDVVLIIDEINRADISKVFGELIYALEYRGRPVSTPYDVGGTTALALPASLHIIGTMNTADRSIAFIDYALRRRFAFVDVIPDDSAITSATTFAGGKDKTEAQRLYRKVATLFEGDAELQELQVGHSYFILSSIPTDEAAGVAALHRKFVFEVLPLLHEYEAEGRFTPGAVDELLASLGAIDPGATQADLLSQLASTVVPSEP